MMPDEWALWACIGEENCSGKAALPEFYRRLPTFVLVTRVRPLAFVLVPQGRLPVFATVP